MKEIVGQSCWEDGWSGESVYLRTVAKDATVHMLKFTPTTEEAITEAASSLDQVKTLTIPISSDFQVEPQITAQPSHDLTYISTPVSRGASGFAASSTRPSTRLQVSLVCLFVI